MATHLGALLHRESVQLDARADDRLDAVRQAGAALVAAGAVEESYVDSMLRREKTVSTYVGEGIALPHGTISGKGAVLEDALIVLRFPDGVDWNGETVTVVIGIAAAEGRHIALLARLADILLDETHASRLRRAETVDDVLAVLGTESS
ncbi:PTS sugar transporter subunit IIA [Planctomonas psychrotolerans]|uniref:PTS sugar transporter subunit IIA n=1 Tax=Planctomonas psychrotolerans TaxID=2528712 RepID=UPI0012392CBD|nr:PTS sugar transporter subunit IIA [Planctomonas psychrotolerans]